MRVLKELREPEKNATAWSQPGCRLVLTGPESLGAACRGCGKSFLLPPLSMHHHSPSQSPHSPAEITFLSLYLSFSSALARQFQSALTCLGKQKTNIIYSAGNSSLLQPRGRGLRLKIGLFAFLQLAARGAGAEPGWGGRQ